MFAHLKVASKVVYLTPQQFLDACIEYFNWAQNTPLLEELVFQNKGSIIRADKKKIRPFTLKGLAQHLSIPASRLDTYRARGEDWAEAVELVEQAIYNQKFDHAAAGLFNPTIIARDLGLAEKTVTTTDSKVAVTMEDLVDEAKRLGIPDELLARLDSGPKEE